MSIEDLNEFQTLASCLNFTYAARLLYISQSTLSKHIMRMEKELKKTLFVRTKTGISLTVEGQRFLSGASEVLKIYTHMIDELRVQENPLAGNISIAVAAEEEYPFSQDFSSVLEERYPDIQIHLTFVPANPLEAVLQEGADLAELYLDELPETVKLQKKPIEKCAFSLLVSKGHPLWEIKEIAPDDLSGRAVIFLESRPGDYHFIKQYMEKKAISPSSEIVLSDPELLAYTVRETKAAAILPENRPLRYADDLRQVAVRGEGFSRTLVYVWKEQNDNPCMETFIKFLEEKNKGCL